jgi:hypothetical protein
MQITYDSIIKSGKVPEANIQAEFYMLCRKNGIQILLEVRYMDCRFDALVFNQGRPFAIIEIKNYGKKCSVRGLPKNGRQWNKYSRFGIPLIEVLNSSQIIPKFNALVEMLNQSK